MKIVDMKRTAADKKRNEEKYSTGKIGGGGDDYHYDHRISLNDEHLKKLGITSEISDGDPVHIVGHGKVISSSSNSRDGKSERRIEIQLHKLGVEKKDKSAVDAVSRGINEAKDAKD